MKFELLRLLSLAFQTAVDKDSAMLPTVPRWNLAREKARGLVRVYTAPPIPVIEIAEGQGVEVLFGEFNGDANEVAGFCDFEAKQIVVNDGDIAPRKHFTIAHELGHWMLHRDLFAKNPLAYKVLPRFQDTSKKNSLEQEANAFAAELLVPSALLRPVKSYSVSALADIFLVSKTMMEYRIKNV